MRNTCGVERTPSNQHAPPKRIGRVLLPIYSPDVIFLMRICIASMLLIMALPSNVVLEDAPNITRAGNRRHCEQLSAVRHQLQYFHPSGTFNTYKTRDLA